MKQQIEYVLSVPGAARLASLAGIKSDLDQVVVYCDRMIERYAGSHLKKTPFDIVGFTTPLDFDDWEALSVAACVTYARCFASGVRGSLDSDQLTSVELKSVHDFIVDLRSKHFAHSVNPFEENVVTVHIGDDFESPSDIQTVTASHSRVAGLRIAAPAELKRLVEWWLAKVDEETVLERGKVLQLARNTPLSELKAGRVRGPGPTGEPQTVRTRRKHS